MPSKRVSAPPARVGRPSKIDQIHCVDPDGTKVLIWQAVVAQLAVQPFIEVAAGACGISKDTIYEWLKRGAHAMQLAAKDGKPIPKAEQVYAEFSDAAYRAQHQLNSQNMELIHRLAEGGLKVETVTVEVDGDGNEVKRTTKTETTLPDLKALTWTQEHAFPALYGRVRVEVSGPEGEPIPVEIRTAQLLERLNAIPVTAVEQKELGEGSDGNSE